MYLSDTSTRETSLAVGSLYVAALLSGACVVSVPANSYVLRQFLSEAQYGALFLPQTLFTILGSIAANKLARRAGLPRLLISGLVAYAIGQALLASVIVVPEPFVFSTLLLTTSLTGLGFGLSAAPLNAYPRQFFSTHPETALVALHTVMGLGFAIGPLAAGALQTMGAWVAAPMATCVATVVCIEAVLRGAFPRTEAAPHESAQRISGQRKLVVSFGAIAVLYAFAEGTFANWAAIFLTNARGLSASTGALAIAAFWAALTVGRLVVSALVARVSARVVWLALPVLMVAVFVALPAAHDPPSAVLLFACAGLACSAFFPLTVAIASDAAPESAAQISSLLVAALMLGVGAGSWLLGALRVSFSFEALYRISTVYPVGAFMLGFMTIRWLRARRFAAETR